MNEPHQARAPTVPRTGRPNREPLDADEVISYALVLAGDLGVSIPKRKRLHRMLKRRIPIPQIYQGADYRLWVDRYYIAAQRLADESMRKSTARSVVHSSDYDRLETGGFFDSLICSECGQTADVRFWKTMKIE